MAAPKDDVIRFRVNKELKEQYMAILQSNYKSITDHLTEFIAQYVKEETEAENKIRKNKKAIKK